MNRGWQAVAARVNADGTVKDVCSGTGAGPTKEYYLESSGRQRHRRSRRRDGPAGGDRRGVVADALISSAAPAPAPRRTN